MKISNFIWIIYPLFVLITVLGSMGSVLSQDFWNQLWSKQDRVDEVGQKVTQLNAKLARLQSVDANSETDNLAFLLTVQPISKPVQQLSAILGQAGVGVGATLQGFKGQAGTISASESATPDTTLTLTAAYTVSDLSQLANLLTVLERSLPLIKVTEVRFTGSAADVSVEGFWATLPKIATQSNAPLPDSTANLDKLRQELINFTALSPAPIDLTIPISTDPF